VGRGPARGGGSVSIRFGGDIPAYVDQQTTHPDRHVLVVCDTGLRLDDAFVATAKLDRVTSAVFSRNLITFDNDSSVRFVIMDRVYEVGYRYHAAWLPWNTDNRDALAHVQSRMIREGDR
jgi:hypothetical protein